MAKNQNKFNFNIQINNFNGEKSYLPHFFSLIRDLSKQNAWNDDQTLLFFKSKLAGAALQYFLENPSFLHLKDLNKIESIFKEFFCADTQSHDLNQFNEIKLLPQEAIRHFAHRLQVITHKAYSTITDEEALNVIKFNKFISAIPAHIRIKLLEENIKAFKDAVDRAHQLNDILQQELNLNNPPAAANNMNITAQLENLTEKVNAIAVAKNIPPTPRNSNQHPTTSNNHYNHQNHRPFNNRRKFNNRPFHRKNYSVCQLCGKSSHKASNCFKYTNLFYHDRRRGNNYRGNFRNTNTQHSNQQNLNYK